MRQANRSASGNRAILLVLILFFGLPPLVGWALILNPEWLPEGRTNNGELIDPPLSTGLVNARTSSGHLFDWTSHRGEWLLLSLERPPCDTACQDRLYQQYQLERALSADRRRLSRLWLLPKTAQPPTGPKPLPPGLEIIQTDPASWQKLTQLLQTTADGEPSVLLVDPFGNLMMAYRKEQPAKQILKDLQWLMRASVHWNERREQ